MSTRLHKWVLGIDGPDVEAIVDVTELINPVINDRARQTVMRWILKQHNADTGCLSRIDGKGIIHCVEMYHLERITK